MRKIDFDAIAKFANQAKGSSLGRYSVKISFNLRMSAEYYDTLSAKSKESKQSMNSMIVDAIKKVYFN